MICFHICFSFCCTSIVTNGILNGSNCYNVVDVTFEHLASSSGSALYLNQYGSSVFIEFCKFYRCYSPSLSDSYRGGAMYIITTRVHLHNCCSDQCYHYGAQFFLISSTSNTFFNDSMVQNSAPLTDINIRYHTFIFNGDYSTRINISYNTVRGGHGTGFYTHSYENDKRLDLSYSNIIGNCGEETMRLGSVLVTMRYLNVISNLIVSGASYQGTSSLSQMHDSILIGNTCRVFCILSNNVQLYNCKYSSLNSGVTAVSNCIQTLSAPTLSIPRINCEYFTITHSFRRDTHMSIFVLWFLS